MSKVYFSKNIETILAQLDLSKLGQKVGIKVHFGEKGCDTFLNPLLAEKVREKIKSTGRDATLVECNVLYKGSRTNRKDHLQTAHDHGFAEPIDILDGELGKDFIEINGCYLGAGLKKYDSLIVLSHFKGHEFAGFGGAIKNVGMGLGSRQGKLAMHASVKPSANNKCTACGICEANCDAKAISIATGKAEVDQEKCVGCAMCIAVCPFGAMNVPWASQTAENLQKKIAEYTAAVLNLFPKPIFISVLENITPMCDCMGMRQEPMMPDVGILYSEDIIAIDRAGLDLADKYSDGKFSQINSTDKNAQIKFAEEFGLGESKYELIEI
jgi:uncharacterized Fe-S center protein